VRAFAALLVDLAIGVADAGSSNRLRPELVVFVPIAPHEHERVDWFSRGAQHLLPETVAIDGAGPGSDSCNGSRSSRSPSWSS
jgi:hypothetical protein